MKEHTYLTADAMRAERDAAYMKGFADGITGAVNAVEENRGGNVTKSRKLKAVRAAAKYLFERWLNLLWAGIV